MALSIKCMQTETAEGPQLLARATATAADHDWPGQPQQREKRKKEEEEDTGPSTALQTVSRPAVYVCRLNQLQEHSFAPGPLPQLQIMTGRGSHSSEGEESLGPLVCLLQQRSLQSIAGLLTTSCVRVQAESATGAQLSARAPARAADHHWLGQPQQRGGGQPGTLPCLMSQINMLHCKHDGPQARNASSVWQAEPAAGAQLSTRAPATAADHHWQGQPQQRG